MLSAPLFHGDVGILDELVLVACIVMLFVALVAFYVVELRKSKEDTQS
jgi:hypothetical protein